MKSYIYKRKNGEEVQFRYTIDRILETEQRTGKSLSELYREVDKLSTMLEIISSAMVGGTYEERKAKAEQMYAEAIENGGTILDLQAIIVEIYRNSGFLTPRQAEMTLKMISLQNALAGENKEDIKATLN